eukprot:IDg8599t1
MLASSEGISDPPQVSTALDKLRSSSSRAYLIPAQNAICYLPTHSRAQNSRVPRYLVFIWLSLQQAHRIVAVRLYLCLIALVGMGLALIVVVCRCLRSTYRYLNQDLTCYNGGHPLFHATAIAIQPDVASITTPPNNMT